MMHGCQNPLRQTPVLDVHALRLLPKRPNMRKYTLFSPPKPHLAMTALARNDCHTSDGERRPKSETFAASYRRVWETALTYGAQEPDHVVRLGHLLQALLDTAPDVLKTLLAQQTLVLPGFPFVAPSASEMDAPPSGDVRVSNLVNKVLSVNGGVMEKVTRSFRVPTKRTAFHLAAAILLEPEGVVRELLSLNGLSPDDPSYEKTLLARLHTAVEGIQKHELSERQSHQRTGLRRVRQRLRRVCFGQDTVLDALIAQIAVCWNQPASARDFRPLSFALIGASGTGKSLLATALRDALADEFGIPSPAPLDMCRYAAEQLAVDLCGRDSNWKDGGRPGQLTERGENFPQGILIIENFDKAHPEAIAHVSTLLTDGKLMDEFTHRSVSFAQNIVILTTNNGTDYLQTRAFARFRDENGGTIPREKLIEGLVATIPLPNTAQKGILDDILAKVDSTLLFAQHTPTSAAQIVAQAVHQTLAHLQNAFSCEVHANENDLRNFFLETRPNFNTAQGLAPLVSTTLLSSLEEALLREDDTGQPVPTIRRITIDVDPLPALNSGSTATPRDTVTFADRTAARLRQAKRLAFTSRLSRCGEAITLHLTDLRYVILPALEEADWFAVRPSDTHLTDLVGMDVPWRQAQRILAYRKSRAHKFLKPDNILLYGPPGTGKTAFAKALAAELDCGFIAINGADLTATARGRDAIPRVQQLFATAARHDAVVFIDEIDALGSRDTATAAQAKVINALLTELDGFSDSAPPLVIGATNHPEMLDPALTRPGRLHARIQIDILRTRSDRARLIDVFCAKTGLALPRPLRAFIVRTTTDWTPASILSVLRETFAHANDRAPTRTDFITARNQEFAGQTNQPLTLSGRTREFVAVHEAGHALTASLYRVPWVQLTLGGTRDALGFLECFRNEDGLGLTEREMTERIDIALAGRAAEELLHCVHDGCASDFAKATEFAQRLVCGGFRGHDELAVAPDTNHDTAEWERLRPRINEILRLRFEQVARLLADNEAALRRIANRLAAQGTLFPDDVRPLLVPHRLEPLTFQPLASAS